jgi:hypothetical protein
MSLNFVQKSESLLVWHALSDRLLQFNLRDLHVDYVRVYVCVRARARV